MVVGPLDAVLHMLDVIHPSFLFEPGLVIVFDLVHTCKIDNTRNGISKPKQLVAKISFASYKHEKMVHLLLWMGRKINIRSRMGNT